MKSYEYIRIERNEALATLLLNRPPVNVLNIPMMEEMVHALAEIQSDSEIRLLILRGEGRCFSAGMDVADHLPNTVGLMFEKMHSLVVSISEMNIPVVAVIHGMALGGGLEIAAMSDLVYAVSGAKMAQPEIKLGVFPPVAIACFPQLIGFRNAYDLILTGRSISAEEALRMGLINAIWETENVEARLQEITALLLLNSKAALALTKKALRKSTPVLQRLTEAEKIYLQELMKTEDAVEGLNAFLQKRDPQWRHR